MKKSRRNLEETWRYLWNWSKRVLEPWSISSFSTSNVYKVFTLFKCKSRPIVIISISKKIYAQKRKETSFFRYCSHYKYCCHRVREQIHCLLLNLKFYFCRMQNLVCFVCSSSYYANYIVHCCASWNVFSIKCITKKIYLRSK